MTTIPLIVAGIAVPAGIVKAVFWLESRSITAEARDGIAALERYLREHCANR